jgi:hypothetical protein
MLSAVQAIITPITQMTRRMNGGRGGEGSFLVYECLTKFLFQVEAEQESDACACEQEIKPLTGNIFFLLL